MRAAATVAVLLLLAGCAADAPAPEPDPAVEAADSGEVPCDQAISREAPDDDELVADAVVLILDPDVVLQVTPIDGADEAALFDGDGLWAKHGLTVRGGRQVGVSVPSAAEDELYIGWGSPAEPGTSVTVECGEDTEWFTFAGGYWVREAGCHTVEVRVDGGEVHEVDVPIGAEC